MPFSERLQAACLVLLGSGCTLGCTSERETPDGADMRVREASAADAPVAGLGVVHGALTSGPVRSFDGTYGGSCLGLGKAGSTWSVSLGGTPVFAPLEVVKNDANCRLSLTRFHTASATYTASAPVPLLLTTASSPTAFSSAGDTVLATAKVDTLSYAGSALAVSLFVGDARSGLAGYASRYTYDAQVVRDAPLSYWRLSEATTSVAQDALNDVNLLDLRNHAAAGITWTLHPTASTAGAAAVFDANLIRPSAPSKMAVYTASTAPPASADYEVQASVRVASLLTGSGAGSTLDQVGVLGRMSSSDFTGYFAGLVTKVCVLGCTITRDWVLRKYVGGAVAAEYVKNASASLVAGENVVAGRSYQLGLRMRGALVEVLVDGVSVLSQTDAIPISTPGSAALLVGGGTATTSASNGTLLDSFDLRTLAYTAYDAIGSNHGAHSSNVTSTAPGALTGPVSSTNGALRLSGQNSLTLNRDARIGPGDLSLEFWFRYAGGAVSSVTDWASGMGMVDANNSALAPLGFGVSMRSDGRVMGGAAVCVLATLLCTGNATILSAGNYGDDAWHHVVFTRRNADGVLVLYVDAVSATAVGPVNQSLLPPATLQVGRTQIQLLNLLWASTYFVGAIDEVAIYDKVLTPAQVSAHYQARGY